MIAAHMAFQDAMARRNRIARVVAGRTVGP